MEPIKVPHLKKNAKLIVTLGSAVVSQLQGVFMYLVQGKDPSAIKAKLLTKEKLTQEEQSIITMSWFLNTISKQAEAEGLLEYKELTDLISL